MPKKFDYDAKTGKGSSGLEDMVLISKIDENTIVENIKKRYNDDLIYTYIGPILIAVNPYKSLPYFTDNELEMYNGCTPHEVPPHIYALTDHMYRDMLIDGDNQCVIISGESGAGKTVSAKYIMSYVAAIAPKAPDLDNVKHIILESNPLLESFGNAKTVRNNNSSRFGKYFQIEFSRGGVPDGGKILNFLLEKSRVVYQQSGERNFHIFYQLTKGASKEEREWLGLASPDHFFYLNQGGTYDADGQDDPKDYKDMRKAMEVCGLDGTTQQSILQLMGAILHLGNIQFVEKGNNAVVRDPNALEYPAYLLGVDARALNEKLTSRLMQTGGGGGRSSMYDVPLNLDQAAYTRNALSKAIYSRVFDFIVDCINRKLVKEKESLALGVLDIYGFEIFDKNGFEQFCINYVNEKLQQIFIELTLKAEQEEYASEGIQWTPIDFFNNKIVCDLIESKKPAGLMAVLDDVCATMHGQSEGADSKFVQKAEGAVSGNPHFTAMSGAFVIKHYAGNVTYTADGFCESNRDTLYKDLIILMQTTNVPFIRSLFPEDTTQDDKKRPTTAAFKIRNQANLLVETLMKCTPHYIRCIKPNETKRSKDWDQQRVLHQVRYLNLKENIRIRRAGFAYRQLFDKFLRRFAILTRETFPHWSGQAPQGVQHIMRAVEMDNSQFQLGRTKVFIKAPESLFMLEELRARKYHTFAIKIQRAYRSWKARKYFLELKAKSQDIMFGQKERKRISLKRDYVGDYIGVLDNPALRTLVGKNERVLFADNVTKYDRRYKPQPRTAILTNSKLLIIALEKATEGPNKGRLIYVFKRQIPIPSIEAVSLSTLCDDYIVIHVPSDYDQLFETVFKTELVTLISQKLQENGRNLRVLFNDNIQYMIKKGKKSNIKFQRDGNVRGPTMKGGTVLVPQGLPKDSRNMQSASAAPQSRSAPQGRGPQGGRPPGGRPQQQQYQQQQYEQPSYSAVSPPQQSYGAPPQQASYGAVPQRPGPAAGGRPPMGGAPQMGAAMGRPNPRPGGAQPPQMQQPVAQMGGAMARPGGARPGAAPGGRPPGAARPPPAAKPNLPRAKALYRYEATEADELTLEAGDIVTVTNKDGEGWWEGTSKGRKGLFPANYVELIQ